LSQGEHMATVTSCGAAKVVTGSCHLLAIEGGPTLLIDCGMFQGQEEDRNYKPFDFDPSEVDYLLVTHAHLDHVGRIPKLVKEGFTGVIYATEATQDLAEIILLDSAKIMKEDYNTHYKKAQRRGKEDDVMEPLYEETDVEAAFDLTWHHPEYDQPLTLQAGISVTFRNAGHILGSAFIEIAYQERGVEQTIVFSGDIGYLILGSVISFSIAAKFLDSISFHSSLGKAIDYHYVVPILLFIPFITAFIYLYLFMKKRLLHLIDLEIFKNFHTYRNFIFSLIGGSVIGTILLIEPHAAFSGKEMVIHLINNKEHIPLLFIFMIIMLRIIGTTVSIYANAVGGLFLPTMSIGALVGYGYGELITQIHHLPLEPFFFAAVGAAVFMGVIMKLPLTAVVLALETTFDYNVMVATGVSVVLVSYLSNLHFDIRKKYVTKADKIVE